MRFLLEYLSGKIRVRDILLDNNNWFLFWLKYAHLIRFAIILNVIKVLACKSSAMGFQSFRCQCCGYEKRVKHTCKSRFCSSCGKKSTEQWIQKNLAALPNVPWQQITFTLPKEFRELFWLNRELFNKFFPIPADILTTLARKKNVIPGIFSVLHTFGRDLKMNVHFHVLVSLGGLSLDKKTWKKNLYFHHDSIKKMWRYQVLTVLRTAHQNQQLILPKTLAFIQNTDDFIQWLQPFYEKKWVVHLAKPERDHKRNVKYIARYLKRPPISETRIKHYDGENVTFIYRDHRDKKDYKTTMTVEEFIKRLIRHIPDNQFRLIRYYNWLSNRNRSEDLPRIRELLRLKEQVENPTTWRKLFEETFYIDPLLCPNCNLELKRSASYFGSSSHDLFARANHYLATLKKI